MNLQPYNSDPQFFSLNCNGKLVDLSVPKLMGILNVTPDSFSDGGKFSSEKNALKQAEKMISEGADFLDIGAQSTRPNAEKISAKQEIERLGNLISTIKKEFPEILISSDTYYSDVVKFGFDEGIDLINDISGGQYDEKMFETVAKTGLPYILMHINPTFETMHKKEISNNIIMEINRYFSKKIRELQSLGIKDILLDPGFGFGKTIQQNHQMIEELQFFLFGKFPVLAGISRKSFIYKPLGKSPLEINEEAQKLHLEMLKNGVKILRVHDIAETQKTLDQFLNFN